MEKGENNQNPPKTRVVGLAAGERPRRSRGGQVGAVDQAPALV